MKLALKFDIVEALRDNLHASPFRRFVVRLHSGEKLTVPNPDVLTVTQSNYIVYDAGKGMRILNATLIASIDSREKPKAAA
ncbi:MAG: hypothetical protein HY736_07500 [Verrucomicrobia bacterium]|nr:hypothetical protein [Verrucomicrobiota bacterium]